MNSSTEHVCGSPSGICHDWEIPSSLRWDLGRGSRSFSTECMKSAGERTPMQHPLSSRTGPPVAPAMLNMWAAPCSDIWRGIITMLRDIMSAAHKDISDLLAVTMTLLLEALPIFLIDRLTEDWKSKT